MTIVIQLLDVEGNRMIEDEEENIREASMFIVRAIEDVCAKHQIRYEDIEINYASEQV